MAEQSHLTSGLAALRSGERCAGSGHSLEVTEALAGAEPELTAEQRKVLLDLARQALVCVLTHTSMPESAELSARLTQRQACFVTLTNQGVLRGCVGQLTPQGPLHRTVVENVQGAALRDPRFPAITAEEIGQLKIEINLLSQLQPLTWERPEEVIAALQPHAHGVVLRVGQEVATFLPQVWEQIPDKIQFLEHLAQKAGCPASAWREKQTEILLYYVECFAEAEGA